MSKRTIFSLLLALLIPLGMRVWALGQTDPCDGYLPGNVHPQSVYVESGTQTVEMPCSSWFPRQPMGFQLTCLAEVAVVVVFGLSAWGDWLRRRAKG